MNKDEKRAKYPVHGDGKEETTGSAKKLPSSVVRPVLARVLEVVLRMVLVIKLVTDQMCADPLVSELLGSSKHTIQIFGALHIARLRVQTRSYLRAICVLHARNACQSAATKDRLG